MMGASITSAVETIMMTTDSGNERSNWRPELNSGQAHFDDWPRENGPPYYTDEVNRSREDASFSESGGDADAYC
ncbi:MAG: hypothetical protein QM784_08390 [Polyangiaceae bacterium]